MKIRRALRVAGSACSVFVLFFVPAAHAQDRPPLAATAIVQPSAEEQALFEATNRERAAQGLQPLQWDPILASAAREHAHVMVRENDLCHQCAGEPPLEERAAQAGARFASIAENIALAPNPDEIHSAWMHSPGHRKNILNPEFTALGIAVVSSRRGLFAVQDFSRPVPVLSLEEQEQRVMALLAAQGLVAANSAEEARKVCKGSGSGRLAGTGTAAVFQFERSDLSQLPDELLRVVHNRPFHKAAVGACGPENATGFVRYRIAVVLY
jgi:uncharacterized protein YkwD